MSTLNATNAQTFDEAVEAFRSQALPALLVGDHATVAAHFSPTDDVTLANPLGPPARGRAAVSKTIEMAAAQLADGSMLEIEETSSVTTPDLGYIVQIEHAQARLGGSSEFSRISLRVTMIFRREDGGWKVVHRHADPILTTRPITSVAAD